MESSSRSRNKLSNSLSSLLLLSPYVASRDHHETQPTKTRAEHEGLIAAVRDLFPNAEHRNCVRHMYQNFKTKHKGKALKGMVWNAVWESNNVIFRKCMEELENEDKAAREWFNHPERPFNTWTRSMFRTHIKCDMLLNNLCESFNRWLLCVLVLLLNLELLNLELLCVLKFLELLFVMKFLKLLLLVFLREAGV
ncbi:uncharacterized protein LOC142161607 isoform X1 [Nicotiana tabacum]|uniref:Uncharacterized protein LOC142161607 isoform X1 n=2 Tax=Nicotiana tabacum TaxID=4097 RepID=A0AC58RN47_TOBAC|nr:PREDICTED: uncharacterized protein LOC107777589 isoform X1 [Nicotiana tabacum]